jgi:hypothetical protein
MTPLLGFLPDADPTTPGVILDCSQVIAYESGMRTAPTVNTVGLPATDDDVRGAVLSLDLSATARFIVGTTTQLLEAGATSYTDVSSTTYALGSDDRWSFAQFGDTVLAATPSEKIQRSTGAAFADITAAPEVKIIEQSLGFAMAFGTNEGTYGDSPDRWWCSAYLDETDWTPAVATQCTTGRLVSSPGPIVAAKRFGDDVIAYKGRSMYVGRYQGPPSVWAFGMVSFQVGCVGIDAVADTAIGHVFVGDDDIYLFDGTVPRSLALGQVKKWFNDNCDPTYRFKCKILWDRVNSLVWIFFPSPGATECDSGIVFHTVAKKWGVADQDVSAVFQFVAPSWTYDGGSAIITTYDALPSISYDSLFWISGSPVPGVVGTDKVVKTLTADADASYFVTGDFGDDEGQTDCFEFRVRFVQTPLTATSLGFTKNEEGEIAIAKESASKSDGKFDVRQQGRFHSFKCSMTGPAKFTAVRPKLQPSGSR